MVSAATAQAVIASISTPVLPSHRTMARTSIVPASLSRSKVMSTELISTGCVSGISDGVCFAARTPATFAVVRTSPFGSARSTSLANVSGAEHLQLALRPWSHQQRVRGLEAPAKTAQQRGAQVRIVDRQDEAPSLRVLQRAHHAEHRRAVRVRLLEEGLYPWRLLSPRPLHGV